MKFLDTIFNRVLRGPIKRWVLKQWTDRREVIINYINKRVDIPGLDEKQEKDLFSQIAHVVDTIIPAFIGSLGNPEDPDRTIIGK